MVQARTQGSSPAGGSPGGPSRTPSIGRFRYQTRFLAIWGAFAILIIASAIFTSASLRWTSIQAILPFAAFLTIAAMGQTIVIMTGGIDLSVPAIVTFAGVLILRISAGADGDLAVAIVVAIGVCAAIGFLNGVLVAIFRLNPIVVTLAMGSVVAGIAIWVREGLLQEARVPASLASFGSSNVLGINITVFVALGLVAFATFVLHYTIFGRRFTAVGANPAAAWIAGIPVVRYQIGAYTAAAILYAAVGILLAAFIRTPTLRLGEEFLLAPIAAVVLGGASLSGGVGSFVATMGGALFFTQLDQALRVAGQPTAVQIVIQGIAIAIGMAVMTLNLRAVLSETVARWRRGGPRGGGMAVAAAAAGGMAPSRPPEPADPREEHPSD